jgi:hypothetical protein
MSRRRWKVRACGAVSWICVVFALITSALLSLADSAAGSAAGTTTASAATFTYDGPAIARIEAHSFEAVSVLAVPPSWAREGSASPSVEGRGTSTTSADSLNATNKVAATGDDLLKPGPWAANSVPSSAPGKITQAERNALNPIGDASGCHSCGAGTPGTKSGNWIGDHQPVSRTVTPGTPQVLYPHCQVCSNNQGLHIINLIRQGKLQ